MAHPPHRTVVLGVCSAAVLLTGGGWAHATTGGGSARVADHAVVEKVVELTEIDLGKKGPSPGDRVVIRTVAMNDAGRKVGVGYSDNGLVKVNPPIYAVNSTLRLSDGDITIGGIYNAAKAAAGIIVGFPIVGGGGRYAGLTGRQVGTATSADTYRSTFRFTH